MHKNTNNLRNKILQYEDIPDRLQLLENSYKDETCYIVSAGPSLKNYTPEYLQEKLNDKLVISVKQSFNILKEIVDFHVLNLTNYQVYK